MTDTGDALTAIRRRIGHTQATMAAALGLSPRAYQDLEKADEVRAAYMLAAEYLALVEAVNQGDPMIASARSRGLAIDLGKAITGR